MNGVDPVTSGLVMSLNRRGANATGVYIFQQVLEEKRLGSCACWFRYRVDRDVTQPNQFKFSNSIEGFRMPLAPSGNK